MKRHKALTLLILLMILLHFSVSGQSGSPASDRAQHERIELLSREIGFLYRRTAEGSALAEGKRELRRLAAQLEALDLEIRRQPTDAAGVLTTKLGRLGVLLEELARSLGRPGGGPSHNPFSSPSITALDAGATPPVAHDSCVAAPSIGLGTFHGSTAGASSDGEATCGASVFSPDVWFKYTAPDSRRLQLDSPGSTYDTVLSVHTACPGTRENQVACNDDSSGLTSALSFRLNPRTDYWIRVSGYDGSAGSFVLSVGNGSAIQGRVVESGSGDPIILARLDAVDEAGEIVGTDFPLSDGGYNIFGVPPGTYEVRATSFRFGNELFDDVPCPGGDCSGVSGKPVVVAPNTTVDDIDFELDTLGEIAGRVTDRDTGDPRFARVVIYDSSGEEVASDSTDFGTGEWRVRGLYPGTYFAGALSSVAQLFDGIDCPTGIGEGGCDPTSGTPLVVAAVNGPPIEDVDFSISRLGAIVGQVTEVDSGSPVPSAEVEIWSSAGDRITSRFTASDGSYVVGGLEDGSYFVSVSGLGVVAELHSDIACPGGPPGGCDPTTGTPIEVSFGTEADVDFVVQRQGAVAGVVTAAIGGDPISGIEVELLDLRGRFLRSDRTDGSGRYRIVGLEPGASYLLRTRRIFSGPFVDEIYDNASCFTICDPSLATSISAAIGAVLDIDFELDAKGRVGGTVTHSVSGDPLAGIEVALLDRSGKRFGPVRTAADGRYELSRLNPGEYVAFTSELPGEDFVHEVYDDIACPEGCNPLIGAPIRVDLNQQVGNIDFALDRRGQIRGRVTSARSGLPLSNIRVFARQIDGAGFESEHTRFNDGTYTLSGLNDGMWIVHTVEPFDFQDELYDDVPCIDCASGFGATPISVALNSVAENIDFDLQRFGRLRGRVVAAATGEPLRHANVTVVDADGRSVRTTLAGFDGEFLLDGLRANPGVAVLASHDDFVPQLYEGVDCPGGLGVGCTFLDGTVLPIALDQTIDNVNFALGPKGSVSGAVLDEGSGSRLPNVPIQVISEEGGIVGTASTDVVGEYRVVGLDTGTYYAQALPPFAPRSGPQYFGEIFEGILCGGNCDPIKGGTPFTVTIGSETTGIDFSLLRVESGIAGTIRSSTGTPISGVIVDLWVDDFRVSYRDSTVTGAGGTYLFDLRDGSYRLSTRNSLGLVNVVYPDLVCTMGGSAFDGDCLARDGDTIEVRAAEMTTGIDFVLTEALLFEDGFESGSLSAWSGVAGN